MAPDFPTPDIASSIASPASGANADAPLTAGGNPVPGTYPDPMAPQAPGPPQPTGPTPGIPANAAQPPLTTGPAAPPPNNTAPPLPLSGGYVGGYVKSVGSMTEAERAEHEARQEAERRLHPHLWQHLAHLVEAAKTEGTKVEQEIATEFETIEDDVERGIARIEGKAAPIPKGYIA